MPEEEAYKRPDKRWRFVFPPRHPCACRRMTSQLLEATGSRRRSHRGKRRGSSSHTPAWWARTSGRTRRRRRARLALLLAIISCCDGGCCCRVVALFALTDYDLFLPSRRAQYLVINRDFHFILDNAATIFDSYHVRRHPPPSPGGYPSPETSTTRRHCLPKICDPCVFRAANVWCAASARFPSLQDLQRLETSAQLTSLSSTSGNVLFVRAAAAAPLMLLMTFFDELKSARPVGGRCSQLLDFSAPAGFGGDDPRFLRLDAVYEAPPPSGGLHKNSSLLGAFRAAGAGGATGPLPCHQSAGSRLSSLPAAAQQTEKPHAGAGHIQVFLIIPSSVVTRLASRTVRTSADDGDDADMAEDLWEPNPLGAQGPESAAVRSPLSASWRCSQVPDCRFLSAVPRPLTFPRRL